MCNDPEVFHAYHISYTHSGSALVVFFHQSIGDSRMNSSLRVRFNFSFYGTPIPDPSVRTGACNGVVLRIYGAFSIVAARILDTPG